MFSTVLLLLLVAEPASPQLGTLEVRSTPGAEVLWEGVSLGVVDDQGLLRVEQVPPGLYRVGLRKEGFHPLDLQVEIELEATTRLDRPMQAVPPPPKPQPPPMRDPAPTSSEPVPQEPRVEPAPQTEPPTTEASLPEADPPFETAAEASRDEAEATGDAQEAAAGPSLSLAPSLVALVALAGGIGLYLGRRRRPQRAAPPQSRPSALPPDPKIISQTEDDTGFIETLKQQEQSLDEEEPGSWKREPEVIDAEFVEILGTREES